MVIGYSGGNYEIMVEEYNGGIVLPLGITTSSWTLNQDGKIKMPEKSSKW
jgi:hypothetical protein